MKKLLLLCAFILVSSSAHAQLGSVVTAKITKVCDLRSPDNDTVAKRYAIGFKKTNSNYLWMQSNVGEFVLIPGQCLNEQQINQPAKKLFMDYSVIYNLRLGRQNDPFHYGESSVLLTIGTGKILEDYLKDKAKREIADLDVVKGRTQSYKFSGTSVDLSAEVTFTFETKTMYSTDVDEGTNDDL